MSEAVSRSIDNRALNKASQVLAGIVTGIVADGQLHDMEIQMLNTWISSNQEVTGGWPGSAIAELVREVLADGRITDDERAHLLSSLQSLVGNDFAETGSVAATVAELPFDKEGIIFEPGQRLCFTGEFLFGTRSACERLSAKAGLESSASVTKRVRALVVGSHISSDWVSTSYGLKIARAMDLRSEGHPILIVHEREWIAALQHLA